MGRLKAGTVVYLDDRAWSADDDLPADVAARITNPAAWEDPAEAPEPTAAPEPPAAVPSGGGGAGPDVAPPPKAGPGSGAPAWREYAAKVGVDVPADAARDAVIEALESAGKPTDRTES